MEDILVRVISLPDSTKRRARFERDNADGLEWRYLDARRGIAAPLTYDADKAEALGGRRLSPGELGCYASHYAAWAELAEHPDATHMIVFEDDVVVDWPFFRAFADKAKEGDAAGLIRFFTALAPSVIRTRNDFIPRYALVQSGTTSFGMAAYALDKLTARVLLDELAEVIEPVDYAIDAYWRHGVMSRIVFPYPVFHRHDDTHIEGDRFVSEPKSMVMKLRRARRRLADAAARTVWRLRNG